MKHDRLIKDFIRECKADRVAPDRLPFEVAGFLRSLGNQSRDDELRTLSTRPDEIKRLIDRLS